MNNALRYHQQKWLFYFFTKWSAFPSDPPRLIGRHHTNPPHRHFLGTLLEATSWLASRFTVCFSYIPKFMDGDGGSVLLVVYYGLYETASAARSRDQDLFQMHKLFETEHPALGRSSRQRSAALLFAVVTFLETTVCCRLNAGASPSDCSIGTTHFVCRFLWCQSGGYAGLGQTQDSP